MCFCLKNLDLLDRQTTRFDFSLSTLFFIFTSFGLKLPLYSLHPKQYIVPGFFPCFIFPRFFVFIFDRVFFMPYIFGSIFLTIHFKHFDFIERFDLNSNFNNLFQRSWISNFLVDFSVCFFRFSNVSTYSTKLFIIIEIYFISINSNKVVINFF